MEARRLGRSKRVSGRTIHAYGGVGGHDASGHFLTGFESKGLTQSNRGKG